MARTEAQRLAAEAGAHRQKFLQYLIERGCHVCGGEATEVTYGPDIRIEVVRPEPCMAPDMVRMRLEEDVTVRCRAHAVRKSSYIGPVPDEG